MILPKLVDFVQLPTGSTYTEKKSTKSSVLKMSQQPKASGSGSNGRRAFELAPDDIKNLIECSVCLTTPRDGYIYQCDNGHLHCSKCHLKLKTCPVCRVPLRNTRNLLAEKQIERY